MVDKRKEIDDLIEKLNHMIQEKKPKKEIDKTIKELEKLLDEYLKD